MRRSGRGLDAGRHVLRPFLQDTDDIRIRPANPWSASSAGLGGRPLVRQQLLEPILRAGADPREDTAFSTAAVCPHLSLPKKVRLRRPTATPRKHLKSES
jgi:hypothetical protein